MTNNDLQGFEVFIPTPFATISQITMTISKTGCRLSKAALSIIKYPEFVNAFFDKAGQRLMITAADKRNQNIIKLSKQAKCPNTITMKCFLTELETICNKKFEGNLFTVAGYRAKTTQPSLIFNLAELKQRKNYDTGNN